MEGTKAQMAGYQLFAKATFFAATKHSKQRRKNTEATPYFNHVAEVADILARAEVSDINVLIAALFHDLVEDTATTLDEIRYQFGDAVASIVAECTDDKSLEKTERKKLQILHVQNASTGAKLVKFADKLSNLRSLLTDPPKGWTRSIIYGYALWSFAVIQGAMGTNNIIESELFEVLSKLGVDIDVPPSEAELEEYYDQIFEK